MTSKTLAREIAAELGFAEWQVANTIALLDEGATIPFLARYRKERTGELDEEQLRAVEERLRQRRVLDERKEEVRRLLTEQGKLTAELAAALEAAGRLQDVEDLYRPFRQKRRTRATIARERGLEPLADLIWAQALTTGDPLSVAEGYVAPERQVPDAAAALQGAADMLAERLADDPGLRRRLRALTWQAGELVVRATPEAAAAGAAEAAAKAATYRLYFDFREPLRKIPPHRVLAVNRGEREGVLKVSLELPDPAPLYQAAEQAAMRNPRSIFAGLLREVAQDAYKRLIAPSLEREWRAELTARAEAHAIRVFARNLRPLLLTPPLRGRAVLGIDPGFRTGCKVAVVGPLGELLATDVIYPHPPQNRREEARKRLLELVAEHGVSVIAIGNGTASRETEAVVAELTAGSGGRLQYTIVSEAGASVYSASKLAREELPELDVSLRGAVSIARRVQDPLAELVKIDPQSIGVGQYQHDVDQAELARALGAVVESCVNFVGVDLNSASPALLGYVAGISATVARNIVAHRFAHGPFRSRAELLKVARLGPATFEQCAGFLRIPGAAEPLDGTAVHPESYALARRILAECGGDLTAAPAAEELAARLGAGVPTVRDIIEALQKPGRDPREDLAGPVLRTDVLSLADLRPGMELSGTVRNVVDFGAFVDLGVKEDGLVHVSELADRFVRDPLEVVAVGDIVRVRVLAVDHQRKRIALSMRTGSRPEGEVR